MKKSIYICCFIYILIVGISCSKEEAASSPTVAYSEENYLSNYLNLTGFNQHTDVAVSGSVGNGREMGIEFTPLVNGVIKSLNVKLPEQNHQLRITIWNAETQTVLRTENVNVITASTQYEFDIEDFSLVKDKKYAITMNTYIWYLRTKSDNSEATYPITVGNIKVNSYKYKQGSSQSYPTSLYLQLYGGDLSFNFLQQ